MNKLPVHLTRVFAFVISLVYGVLCAGQILGFMGLYRDWLAVILSILIAAAVFHYYLKHGRDFFVALHGDQAEAGNKNPCWSGLSPAAG